MLVFAGRVKAGLFRSWHAAKQVAPLLMERAGSSKSAVVSINVAGGTGAPRPR